MFNTEYYDDKTQRCETIEEFKNEIVPELESLREQWRQKVLQMLEETGYTKVKFAKLCNVSRQTLDKWCKGISMPDKREQYLKIGMAANYGIEEMNLLLQRYGRYSGLYSKTLEDCVCMFVLQQNYGAESYEKYQYILNRIKDNIFGFDAEGEDITTAKFDEKLARVEGENELERFITENIALFSLTYRKLYSRIKLEREERMHYKTDSEAVAAENFRSNIQKSMSEMNQNKWEPRRNKIICFGLHLGMDVDEINELLALAHMEPLCAKNIYESAIIFAVQNVFLSLDDESDNLPWDIYESVKNLLKQLEWPEIEDFLSEKEEKKDEQQASNN